MERKDIEILSHPSKNFDLVESSDNLTSIERLETIASVDRDAWDRIAPDDVYSSYGWLRTVEETALFGKSLYFIVRQSGSLVAAAACRYELSKRRRMDRFIFGRFTRVARIFGMSISPALVCGSSIGLSQHVRVDPSASPEQRQRWTMLLIDAMERFTREQKMSLGFRNMVDDSGPLAEMLKQRGYLHALEMPTTMMDIKWSSFGEYLRELKREHPSTAKNIRGEISIARKGGLVFRKLGDDIADAPRLHALLDAHNQRLNHAPFEFRPEFLKTLKHHLGDKMIVHVALDGDDPIGISVGLRAGDAIFYSIGGTDVARGHKTRVYFNNSYNVPIEDAITTGIKRIYSGKMMYNLKMRRGYRMLNLGAYLYVHNRLRAALLARAFAIQRARIRRMAGEGRSADPSGAAT